MAMNKSKLKTKLKRLLDAPFFMFRFIDEYVRLKTENEQLKADNAALQAEVERLKAQWFDAFKSGLLRIRKPLLRH